VSDSPAARYLLSLGKGSKRTVQESLVRLAFMVTGVDGADPFKLRWERLRRPDTVRLRAELKGDLAPATANKILSVIRGVLRACRDMGLMSEGDFQAAASLEMVKAKLIAKAVPVSAAMITSLFDACEKDATAAGRRDAALLAIFLSSGLRRAEAAGIDVGDYEALTGRLHIRGDRPEYDRFVTLPKASRRLIAEWLAVRTSEPGPLLLPVDRGGLIRFRRMTDQAIYDIFGRLAARAGCPEVTLRDLRREYVVRLIRAGKTVEEVQYLAGHASWVTRARYRELAECASRVSK
jgi:integrase